MTKKDWLLLFVGLPVPGQPEIPALDPVRVMKGMFLVGQQVSLPAGQAYDFIPYLYGPCSFAIYSDLDELVAAGVVAAERPSGRAWNLYTPTPQGRQEAERLEGEVRPKVLSAVREIKQYVTSTPFRRLLREIYDRYPSYATESLLTPR